MTEFNVIQKTDRPLTFDILVDDLAVAQTDRPVLIHSSLSSLGWVCGGIQTAAEALLHTYANTTLCVPTHTAGNSAPDRWVNPPVPHTWWETIRDNSPAFDPANTPSQRMGAIAEAIRTHPESLRSNHPVGSFAAIGELAKELTADVPFDPVFGEGSFVSRLYDHDAWVLLLGVDHFNNTSLHLAEYRAQYTKETLVDGCALLEDDERVWKPYEMLALDTDDFQDCGQAFEEAFGIKSFGVGNAKALFFSQRKLVDFASEWFSIHRP